ncbi:MAG TPA: helix-turn-helix domain-containing protein [Gemmataceae bacterium]|nr:helix-turn-helix domain-containing protein [Gemmataceae bacterium]
MVNYYTLEEAARILGVSADELRRMAEHNEIRAFRDRGNLRFRVQDIQERARQLGRGSDPDLQLGEVTTPRPRPSDSPAPRKGDSQTFEFELSADQADQVDLGDLGRGDQPSSKRRTKPSSSKLAGPKSPPPKSGSDSDVRLVPDGSAVDFQIASDSDVKMIAEPPPPSPPPSKKVTKRKPDGPETQEDSGVRIVPLESDSDVRVAPEATDEGTVLLGSVGPKSASDSDIRLQQEPSSARRTGSGKKKAEPPVTEEIDLDAELREAGVTGPGRRRSGLKAPQQPSLPTGSPFELSDADLNATKPAPAPKEKGVTESSSDFDLTPVGKDDSSPLDLDSDEAVSLGELTGRGSGINLQDPADSGISLEQGGTGEDMEIELSLDAAATPKPSPGHQEDSSSEFELSLDSGSTPSPKSGVESDSDSEFELTLDASESAAPAEAPSDSDSEFELTLDAGGLAPLESGEQESGERDIFETDFEVPALDEESGSEAVALEESDTELESADDMALSEEDAAGDEASGSQVVALEEEEEERPRRRRALEEEEAEERAAVAAAPADWGLMPALVLFPSVLVMFLAALMAFELVHNMWGYHQPSAVGSPIVRGMASMFTDDLPKP